MGNKLSSLLKRDPSLYAVPLGLETKSTSNSGVKEEKGVYDYIIVGGGMSSLWL